MSYNFNVFSQQEQVEYQKFVQFDNDTRYPPVSVTRYSYRDSAPPISSVDVYPKTAVMTYITNPQDIQLILSASNVDIGNVGVIDHSTGNDVFANILETGTVGGIRVGRVQVNTQDYPQLDQLVSRTSILTGVDYATSAKQTIANNLLNALTGKDFATTANQVVTNNLLNNLTGKDFATTANQIVTNTLLNTVTANQATEITLQKVLTGKDFATDTSLRALTAVTYDTRITNTVPVSGSVTILNPVSTVNVTGSVATNFNPTQVDAFNRLRVSNPLTLFDSSHRFRDNNLWSTLSAGGGSVAFNLTQGLMDLNVTNTAGASALRETTKVFAYQPGKSLLVMNTFVMGASATGLVQRVGYFGNENGIYFQMEDNAISFVERSIVTGSLVNTVTPRSSWNGDKLDGTGPSGVTLDITKAQIMWMDIEWLGVGTVRTGFIINGQFITCHSFHHANIINSTYITTASLPLRYEIFNKSATAGSKTLKQICSTVISEGGYELGGLQQAVSIPINAPRTFAAANTYYPIISIKLRTDRLDAIVILTALSILGDGNNKNYNWQVRASGTTTGGTWLSAGSDSAVEYNISGTSFAGGRILASGYVSSNNQSSPSVDILKEALFKFQLERNYFTGTPYELTLVAAINDAGATTGMLASMDWEEVNR